MTRFRKLAEREIWAGHVVAVAVASFESPSGAHFEREIVHHPGAVSVVPVEGDHAILVRQFRAAIGAELLEIPAGKRDVRDEPPEITARRELAEEIGYEADALTPLAEFYNSPGFCDEHAIVYLATGLRPCPRDAQGEEESHMTIERVALAEVTDLIRRRVITDAKTIIGLTLAAERLRRDH